MIADLKPYPAMKDSGVPWLGHVPGHWEVRRIKTLFREKDERNGASEGTLLSLTRAKGIVPQAQASSRIASTEDLSKYKTCRPGDLVMNRMQAWAGMFALSNCTGVVSPDYSVFDAIAEAEVKFFEHLFKTPVFVDQFAQRSKGIGSGFNRLYTPDFGAVPAVVPPLPEQVAIVRFLATADRRIRRYIRAKQKLIKLLEEQKQAIIHRAVTRGLDPNVRLKPSGVEWLGDVPEHWEVRKVKTEFCCLNRRRVPLSGSERGEMTVRRYDYYGASGVIDKVESYLFDDELLLIAEDGANLVLRNLPLAIIARGKFWVNNHAHILKPKRGNLEYLAGVMEQLNYLPWISGAAQPKLTQDRLMSIAVAVPPREEQDSIIARAAADTAVPRAAIDHAKREIDLLREYRTRLIADVVTGKLDVREAAAGLPDEAEEPEPLYEADALADAEDAMADDLDTELQEAEA